MTFDSAILRIYSAMFYRFLCNCDVIAAKKTTHSRPILFITKILLLKTPALKKQAMISLKISHFISS